AAGARPAGGDRLRAIADRLAARAPADRAAALAGQCTGPRRPARRRRGDLDAVPARTGPAPPAVATAGRQAADAVAGAGDHSRDGDGTSAVRLGHARLACRTPGRGDGRGHPAGARRPLWQHAAVRCAAELPHRRAAGVGRAGADGAGGRLEGATAAARHRRRQRHRLAAVVGQHLADRAAPAPARRPAGDCAARPARHAAGLAVGRRAGTAGRAIAAAGHRLAADRAGTARRAARARSVSAPDHPPGRHRERPPRHLHCAGTGVRPALSAGRTARPGPPGRGSLAQLPQRTGRAIRPAHADRGALRLPAGL
ncbi:hypothetical protein XPN_2053, partial [Xanthomonas arboricola pv. pruni MAFF 301427]